MKKHLIVSMALLCFISDASIAEHIVDCRVFTGTSSVCNPFGSKLIRAKEVPYEVDTKKLIISKTLPLPEKKVMKVISVPEMIERYIKVEDSVRFKGNDSNVTKVTLPKHKIEETKELLPKQVSPIKKIALVENNDTIDKNTSMLTPEGTYRVVSGDVFSKIAQKFGFSTQTLLTLNQLDKNTTLHIGQEIKIPLSQKMVDAIANAEYTIQKGDTLLSIAHTFNVDSKALAKFNHLKSSSMIREGKVLQLPLPYVMKKLEAQKKIALAKKKKDEEKKKRALAKKEKAKKRASRIKARISNRKLYVKNKKFGRHKLRVTATAYSSHRGQTDSTPFLAAWNNRLRPGMKIIAVSRDLISRYGLRNGTKVKIGGLRGYYRVRDKMNKRFRKRIDIYMGVDRRRALRWGRRSVVIYW